MRCQQASPHSHGGTASTKFPRLSSTVCASIDDGRFSFRARRNATQTIKHNNSLSPHVLGVPTTAETSLSMYNVRPPCPASGFVSGTRTRLIRASQPECEHARFDGTKARVGTHVAKRGQLPQLSGLARSQTQSMVSASPTAILIPKALQYLSSKRLHLSLKFIHIPDRQMSTPNNDYVPGQHPNMADFLFPFPYIPTQHTQVAGHQSPPPCLPNPSQHQT